MINAGIYFSEILESLGNLEDLGKLEMLECQE